MLSAWSWRVATLFGIPIYIHWTFLILIAWLVYGHWADGHDVATTLRGVGFVLAIFACVVLHELGHAFAARHFGIPTRDITLLPIGGVARLERMPEKPAQELVVALAGPAVNVVIVLVLLAIGVRITSDHLQSQALVRGDFLPRLMFVNGFLVLFNLLPAFPMDGGRVLRALLGMFMDYGRATRIAASVGQAMAIVFGFLGLTGNPMLLLIALFVWIGAQSEAASVLERIELRGISVRQAMLTDYHTLAVSDTLGRAVQLLLSGSQREFPVTENGLTRGVLTRDALVATLAEHGRDARVDQAMLALPGTVSASEPLAAALDRLRSEGLPALVVLEGNRPIGLLTLENITELLMVRSALLPQGLR
jgi:Zn-dependent protease/CBS domain-containing protein